MQLDISPAGLSLAFIACSALLGAVWRIGVASDQIAHIKGLQNENVELRMLAAVLRSDLNNLASNFSRCRDQNCAQQQHAIVDALERIGTPLHEPDLAERVRAEAEVRLPFQHHRVLPPISEEVVRMTKDKR